MSAGSAPAPARRNTAVLRVDTGPIAGPLLGRVVAMMLARADCPVDRLDDAMLLCDTLVAHARDHSIDGHLEFRIATSSDGLQLRVGALQAEGAKRLVREAVLPGIGSVLEPIADELRIEQLSDGTGDELVLGMGFGEELAGGGSRAPRS